MYVRLAFAVAAHLEPEILIIDEVLAVGDAEFQKKCLGKMKDVAEQGRTVLFVSHNMLAIRRLCSRALLLGQGTLIAQDETLKILKEYESVALAKPSHQEWPEIETAPGSDICRIRRLRIVNRNSKEIESIDVTESFIVEMTFDVIMNDHILIPNFHFHNDAGECLFVSQDLDPTWRTKTRPTGRYCCKLLIPENLLAEGRITIGAAITSFNPFFVHTYQQDAVGINVIDSCDPKGSRGDYVGPLPGTVRPLLQTLNEYLPLNPETPLAND
jgi:lipopolysaccharide transport system ATP-binding protein